MAFLFPSQICRQIVSALIKLLEVLKRWGILLLSVVMSKHYAKRFLGHLFSPFFFTCGYLQRSSPFCWFRTEFSAVPAVTFGNVHPSDVLDMPVDPNEPTYCLCHQVSYGEMIGCDNTDVS